jgi:hypothetical protein
MEWRSYQLVGTYVFLTERPTIWLVYGVYASSPLPLSRLHSRVGSMFVE